MLGLGVDGGGEAAKELLRLLLLGHPSSGKDVYGTTHSGDWEAVLSRHDTRQPLVVRVGRQQTTLSAGDGIDIGGWSSTSPLLEYEGSAGHVPVELHVPSCPGLGDRKKVEILLVSDAATGTGATTSAEDDALLAPTVDVPVSASGSRVAPVTTPVHRTLVVGEGIRGAAEVLTAGLPSLAVEGSLVAGVVDIPGYAAPPAKVAGEGEGKERSRKVESDSVNVIDLDKAASSLNLRRENAAESERLWAESGVGRARDWLLRGVEVVADEGPKDKDEGDVPMRQPVRALIESLLADARLNIEVEKAALALESESAPDSSASSTHHLSEALASWSASAHTEIQACLDEAFASRPWRRGAASWWRLLVYPGRADDVTGVAATLLRDGFLVSAERDSVFLAGRIAEAAVFANDAEETMEGKSESDVALPRYETPGTAVHETADGAGAEKPGSNTSSPPPPPPQADARPGTDATDAATAAPPAVRLTTSPYPLHINHTRNYLITTTAPAIQALAQRLVLACMGTSATGAALGALVYLSQLGAGWAGASASLVAVLALRRLQSRWETARSYWESEVREEGRKAIWRTEHDLKKALQAIEGEAAVDGESLAEERRELEVVERLVKRAEEALAKVR